MSSKYQPKNKKLSGLKVCVPDDVWEKKKDAKTGKNVFRFKSGLKIVGKIEKGHTGYITNHNKEGKNVRYVDDFSSLNKNTKSEIVDLMHNQNKRVLYLVGKETKSKINKIGGKKENE